MQAGLFDSPVAVAIERIRSFEPPEGYYVAFSGGKDSVVMLDLVERAGVKFDAHQMLTTVDPPELLRFVRTHYAGRVALHQPERGMFRMIGERGSPPTRIARFCCEMLKERAGADRRVVTGVRWAESVRRRGRRMVEICTRGGRKTYLHPIIDWTTSDVWQYIRDRGLPVCSLYAEGRTRIGCVGCPMAGSRGQVRDFERWPRFKRAYLRAFEWAVKTRKERGMPTSKQWADAQAMFDWWVGASGAAKNEGGGCPLFE